MELEFSLLYDNVARIILTGISKCVLGDLYRNCDEPYEKLSEIFVDILNHQAPIREKQIRGNQAPFMNKQLSLAIMEKSKTRN